MDIYSLSNITKNDKSIENSHVYAFNMTKCDSYYAKMHATHLIFQNI
jgi:hypothetical protein